MSTVISEMPVLSLSAVLFPGTFLPVRISDPAQRRLVHACAEQSQSLGVVLNAGVSANASQVPHTMGCTATVAVLLDAGEEEPLGAVLYGEQRMRVTHYLRQDPYAVGGVELLDEYSGPHAERRTKQASRLFQQYLELIRQRFQAQVVNVPLPDDPVMASYLLAAVLYLPLDVKQRWLESVSAALRLQEELAFLHLECDRLTTILALSQHTQHRYALPDCRFFASLVSTN